MNTQLCLKKFFSYFIFFDAAQKIQRLESRFQERDKFFRYQLCAANDTIKDLQRAVADLERDKIENMATIKKRAMEINLLYQQLAETRAEKIATREKLSALNLTHKKLVKFLEKNNTCPSP